MCRKIQMPITLGLTGFEYCGAFTFYLPLDFWLAAKCFEMSL
jgi:hypothetical protein